MDSVGGPVVKHGALLHTGRCWTGGHWSSGPVVTGQVGEWTADGQGERGLVNVWEGSAQLMQGASEWVGGQGLLSLG